MRKRFLAIICILAILSCSFFGCAKDVEDFTEEEHIYRISKRIKNSDRKFAFPEGETYEDFEIYPMYDQNDKLTHFLVEFEPYGFMFVLVKGEGRVLGCLVVDMYLGADSYGKENPWTPYTRDKDSGYLPNLKTGEPTSYKGDLILDENGEMIIYYRSPYFVTGNVNERKYLIKTTNSVQYICAIKKGDKFINLISGLEFEWAEEYVYEENATIDGSALKGYDL